MTWRTKLKTEQSKQSTKKAQFAAEAAERSEERAKLAGQSRVLSSGVPANRGERVKIRARSASPSREPATLPRRPASFGRW
jgi:hypothetical protein